MKDTLLRGDVYLTNLGSGSGSEHQGTKYCVVIQNNIGNKYSTTTVVIPMTQWKKSMPTHAIIDGVLEHTSYVVCEQIRVIDTERLIKRVSKIPNEQMWKIENAVKIQLGLN